MKTTVDTIAARELYLFATNDQETYFRSLIPALENLHRKQIKGIFDPEKAVKLFEYSAKFAAQRYCTEFGGTYHKMFNAATREAVAAMLLDDFQTGSLE